jgi:ribosomal protein S27AE
MKTPNPLSPQQENEYPEFKRIKFYCGRCNKGFMATGLRREDNFGNIEYGIWDDRCYFIDVNNDMRYLFCPRCSKVFGNFLYRKRRRKSHV